MPFSYPKHLRLPRLRYRVHKGRAKAYGIKFTLTFEQWWKIWRDSGHWHECGRGPDKYCMARGRTSQFADRGGYELGNVRIITGRQNRAEQRVMHSDEWREHHSAVTKGRKLGKWSKARRKAHSIRIKEYFQTERGKQQAAAHSTHLRKLHSQSSSEYVAHGSSANFT